MTSGQDGRLLLTNIESGHLVQEWREKEEVKTGRLNRTSDMLASGGATGMVRLYHLKTRQQEVLGH